MAVYAVRKAELVRVADSIEDVLVLQWDKLPGIKEALAAVGFVHEDDVPNAYWFFQRADAGQGRSEGALPGIRYVWAVFTDSLGGDFIIANDNLPDYLAVMGMLMPMVHRAEALEAELNATWHRPELV